MITTLTLILIAAVAYSLVCGFVGRAVAWVVLRVTAFTGRHAGCWAVVAPYKGADGTHIS